MARYTDAENYQVALVSLADEIATHNAKGDEDYLRRFRIVYRHLAGTVEQSGQARGTPGAGLLQETDERLRDLEAGK